MNSNTNSILIVEDSVDDYYATTRGLKAAGLRNGFIHYETGEAAMDYLLRNGPHASSDTWALPHLVLLDLNLPGLDGIEVLRACN